MSSKVESSADDLALLTATNWIAEHGTLSPQHFLDRELYIRRWQSMAALGWPGAAIAESDGGFGFGVEGIGALLAKLGRELVASPLLSTGLLGSYAVVKGGSAQQRSALLPRLALGEIIVAVAIDEGAHHNPDHLRTVAENVPDGWRLQGSKRFVLDAPDADFILIAAQTPEGPSLFLVEQGLLNAKPVDVIDGRSYAHLQLDGIIVPPDSRLAGSRELIHGICDLARIGLAAELTGACEKALEITVDYLKIREQFGVKIGTFQALQHRAARMFVDLELAKSCVQAAWRAAAANSDETAELSLAAKFMAGAAMHNASIEIVQMHGGIGMTEAHVAGRYLKWARVTETLYGNASFLADRYATLKGY
jgi:alkylation response protein AidB-like acyl-CoA dehydrogenase